MSEPDVTDRAVGLLEQIADTALDDDYYVVRVGHYSQSREFNTVLTGVVLAVVTLLVTIAVLQTRNDRPVTQRERGSLISSIDQRKKLLASHKATEQSLANQVTTLRASADRVDPDYQSLRVQTGDLPATGPGVTVIVSPSYKGNDDGQITDQDLQILVNGLWYAGAEAISINGNRIGTLTSIRSAGDAITVNIRSIGPPYTVVALGDGETLGPRFANNPGGLYWATKRQDSGVRFSVASSSQLTVPAVPTPRQTTPHATPVEGPR